MFVLYFIMFYRPYLYLIDVVNVKLILLKETIIWYNRIEVIGIREQIDISSWQYFVCKYEEYLENVV